MGQRGEEQNPDLFNLQGKERHGETYVEPKLPEKLGALFHQSRDKSLFFGNISVILLESKGQADRNA